VLLSSITIKLNDLSDSIPVVSMLRTATTNRREAAIDCGVALAVVLVSLASLPMLTPVFRRLTGLAFVLVLAAFQFSSEGLVPLILIAIRRERFSDYGFTWLKVGNSIALAVLLAAVYDLALSLHAGSWVWIPLRRHNAMRNSLAAGFPSSVVGFIVVIAAWGFFEAFFGVFLAKKVNQLLGHDGNGWLAPGVLGFALFNGALHAAIGQGVAGFVTSFASGYGIAVIPALTKNAWGSGLFQTATNAVGGF
jgi:hypothetical protein